MQYKFVNCQHKDFDKIQYGYVLEISTFEQFMDYIVVKFYPELTKSIQHLIKALEKNRHAADELSNAILVISKTSEDFPIDVAKKLADSMIQTQLKILDNGPLYIHKNGSYMPGGAIKIHDTLMSDELVWPTGRFLTDSDIKIDKWFGGNHYYIRVDEVSLDKQNTPERAMEVAREYVEKHNQKLREKNG